MIKNLLPFIVLLTTYCFSSAPFFPNPELTIQSKLGSSDAISQVFNGRYKNISEQIELSIAHQNQEWGYDWFLMAISFPFKFGTIGVGYSNYGISSLPNVEKDNVGAYISGTNSDKFESVYLSYITKLKWLNITNKFKYLRRELVDQTASAFKFDIRVTSPKVLNNQLGIKTVNLMGSDYKWSAGDVEELATYISPFYFYSSNLFKGLIEYNHSLNYSDLSGLFLQAALTLTDGLELSHPIPHPSEKRRFLLDQPLDFLMCLKFVILPHMI